MAPAPKGVIFGPVKDSCKGGVNALMWCNDFDCTTKIRKYKLEEVTNWATVGRLIKLRGEEELGRAVSRTEKQVEETNNVEAGSWVLSVTQEKES